MTKTQAKKAAEELRAKQEAADAQMVRATKVNSIERSKPDVTHLDIPKYSIEQQTVDVVALGCKVQVAVWCATFGTETMKAMDRDDAVRWLAAKRQAWKGTSANMVKKLIIIAKLHNYADRIVECYNDIEKLAEIFPETEGAYELERALRSLEKAITDINDLTPDTKK